MLWRHKEPRHQQSSYIDLAFPEYSMGYFSADAMGIRLWASANITWIHGGFLITSLESVLSYINFLKIWLKPHHILNINGLEHDCCISTASALVILQSGTKCFWVLMSWVLNLTIMASTGISVDNFLEKQLTHWGRVTHICVSNLTIIMIIGSDNGLSPGRRQAIIRTNDGQLIVNWTLRNKLQWNFSRNSNIFIQENVFESVVWKMAAILSWPQQVETMILMA